MSTFNMAHVRASKGVQVGDVAVMIVGSGDAAQLPVSTAVTQAGEGGSTFDLTGATLEGGVQVGDGGTMLLGREGASSDSDVGG